MAGGGAGDQQYAYIHGEKHTETDDQLETNFASPISQIWTKSLVMVAYIPDNGTLTSNPLIKLLHFMKNKSRGYVEISTHSKIGEQKFSA